MESMSVSTRVRFEHDCRIAPVACVNLVLRRGYEQFVARVFDTARRPPGTES
jgi:hypothetical protein